MKLNISKYFFFIIHKQSLIAYYSASEMGLREAFRNLKKKRKIIRNLFLVYYIVSNDVKVFRRCLLA